MDRPIDQRLRDKIWDRYHLKDAKRRVIKLPTICVIGPGGAGKDTVGEWFQDYTVLEFKGSTSWVMAPYVAESLGQPVNQAFESRRDNRQYWRDFIDAFRREDEAIVAALSLGQADIVAGLRTIAEMTESKRRGMVDLSIWVDNPRAPPDPTLEITSQYCDVVIQNAGTLTDLYERLETLCHFRSGLMLR